MLHDMQQQGKAGIASWLRHKFKLTIRGRNELAGKVHNFRISPETFGEAMRKCSRDIDSLVFQGHASNGLHTFVGAFRQVGVDKDSAIESSADDREVLVNRSDDDSDIDSFDERFVQDAFARCDALSAQSTHHNNNNNNNNTMLRAKNVAKNHKMLS